LVAGQKRLFVEKNKTSAYIAALILALLACSS